jgi:hypothetical protein
MSPQEQHYELPCGVFERDGPFDEFKQDAAFVTVELTDGRQFAGVLLLYPNQIIAVQDYDRIPFDPSTIVRAYQTSADLQRRSRSDWTFWGIPTM